MDREKTETLSLEEDDEIVIVEPIAESKEERMVLEKQVREEESGLPLPLEEEGVGQAVAPVAASELVVEERTAVGPREGVVKPASVDGKGEESRPTKRRKVSVEPPSELIPLLVSPMTGKLRLMLLARQEIPFLLRPWQTQFRLRLRKNQFRARTLKWHHLHR